MSLNLKIWNLKKNNKKNKKYEKKKKKKKFLFLKLNKKMINIYI
jgi:hypothetical protein